MNKNIEVTKTFYNASYSKNGFDAQRRYPNEELCRFMGRNFFSMPSTVRKKTKILETGCGSGANLWMIAKENFDTYGVDLSEESIKLCDQMLKKYNVSAQLSVQNMASLEFSENTFDAVIDVFSSYCLDQSQAEDYLRGVFKILKPGGFFFSYFPSKRSDAFINHSPASLLDSNTVNSILREGSPYQGQLYPFRFLHPEEYKKNLIQGGFAVQYLETVSRTYDSRKEYFEFVVIEAKKLTTLGFFE